MTSCRGTTTAEGCSSQPGPPGSASVPPTKWGANGLLVNDQGKIWIPTNALSMQVRLCVIAHCGRRGHRGHQVTLTAIQDHYCWKEMSKDIKAFVGSCYHFIASAPGETTPRPLGESLHATKPNEVIHFDYLYMGHPPMTPSVSLLSRMTTVRIIGSRNARRMMLIVQHRYSLNGLLSLALLHNGPPTKVAISRTIS
jgi:Integrase zinc binding domain